MYVPAIVFRLARDVALHSWLEAQTGDAIQGYI